MSSSATAKLERFDRSVELVLGDVARQPGFDAVVNAANAGLMPGQGVAGAIHRAAGPGLAEECRELAPILPGEAVLTGGHGLLNRYVIHCLGPRFGSGGAAPDLLASCYLQALELADRNWIESIAFPAIATGACGYPMDEAAEVALGTVLARLPDLAEGVEIRFVLATRTALELHVATLERLAREPLRR